jgi:hypothetical protein
MQDDLERQLKAFGATLESQTGEPIATDSSVATPASRPPSRRWWSIAGAAACLIAVVVGLVALTGRNVEAPAAQPPAATATSTSVPTSVMDPAVLQGAPIVELLTGCDPSDVLLSEEFVAAGVSVDESFAIGYQAMVDHTPPEVELLPRDGWAELLGEPIVVRFLDRGQGIEGLMRLRHDDDGWRIAELAQCLPGRVPSAVQTTTIPPTVPDLATIDPVGDDPLALQRDGWTLVQRTVDAFAMSSDDIPCDVADVLVQINGVAQVHDILTPPDGTGLDLDVQILDMGSPERGQVLSDFVSMIGRCIAETEGVDLETGAMSSVRATWFRAGPDFALVAIVGEGPRSIVLEMEGAPFDDDLIGELAHRADQFLRGVPITAVDTSDGAISATALAGVGVPQVEPVAGQVKLWVSNQSFDDDPVAIEIAIDGVQIVDDSFLVDGQHNWIGFMIDGLDPGNHTLIATSDTGATFEGTFTLPPDEPRWMVVDYWYYTDDAEGRHFTFNESDEPIYFA